MSVNEQNVTGRKYRVWDAANNIWKRLSFWTKASDVELNDGTTVETTMGLVKGKFYETTEQAMADLANIPVGSMVYTNDGDSYNVNASNVIYDDGTQQGSNLQIQVEALKSDLSVFSFRDNEGQAQYSMDDGENWQDFKHPVGTKSITANGIYDVTDYASANVSVAHTFNQTTYLAEKIYSPGGAYYDRTVTMGAKGIAVISAFCNLNEVYVYKNGNLIINGGSDVTNNYGVINYAVDVNYGDTIRVYIHYGLGIVYVKLIY